MRSGGMDVEMDEMGTGARVAHGEARLLGRLPIGGVGWRLAGFDVTARLHPHAGSLVQMQNRAARSDDDRGTGHVHRSRLSVDRVDESVDLFENALARRNLAWRYRVEPRHRFTDGAHRRRKRFRVSAPVVHRFIMAGLGWAGEWRLLAPTVSARAVRSAPMDAPSTEIVDGVTTWRFDRTFLTSRWTCIWGRGCLGILPERDAAPGHGCCSIGAELDGEDEAHLISALAATLEPAGFQYFSTAAETGVFSDADRHATRVVDGACIFLNRPGFGGGAGCALHLAAVKLGESPVGLKPSVCWQLPIKVDWQLCADGTEVATVRGWTRQDWGTEGVTMAWCCTEGPEAFVGDRPVVESMADALEEIIGTEVYVELRRRLAD